LCPTKKYKNKNGISVFPIVFTPTTLSAGSDFNTVGASGVAAFEGEDKQNRGRRSCHPDKEESTMITDT
jgi:hypothetical protein